MSQQPNPMDAMVAFWKDAMSRMGASGGAHPGPAAPTDPLGWMPTPEQMRRMQSTFLDSMAAAADEYMRSPRFLEAMRQSLDSALDMRRGVEELVRRNMSDALRSDAPPAGELRAALAEMESRIGRRLDELAERLDRIDRIEGGAGADAPKPARARPASRGRRS